MSETIKVESPSVKYGWNAKDGTYELPGKCFNCGEEAVIVFRRRQRTAPVECQNCGCRTMSPKPREERTS